MQDLARWVAAHPVEVLIAAVLPLMLLVWLLSLVLQRLRQPLWRSLLYRWQRLARHPRLRSLLQRFPALGRIEAPAATAGGYLLLDLLFGFALALGAATTFFALADEIGIDEGMGRFDRALAAELAASASPELLQGFARITRLADVEVQTVICIGVAALLLWRRRRLLAVTWIAAVAGNGLMTRLLKWIFARDRPLHDHGVALAHGYSFPSGHASGAMAVYGMLAYLLIRATPGLWHVPIALSTAAVVLSVGYSRVVLQVHYFSDVLAGFVVAAGWLVVCIAAARLIRAHRRALAVADRGPAGGG
ncbi:phosphatase PAP2 family protein [Panacagrimonas sp.]|uniref:phosphatase PAP2 family protein n=1 Tax=Panacagrimonas sp. TaxID=2480088 RepID=UPI003B519D23